MSPVLHAFLSLMAAADAPADGGQAPGGALGALGGLPFLVLIAAVFYFIVFRPQQKQAKAHREFLGAIKKGDDVITQGGILGTVVLVEDRTVTIDVGAGTKLRVVKGQIAGQWKAVEAQQPKMEAKK